jgi:hypothetical protein
MDNRVIVISVILILIFWVTFQILCKMDRDRIGVIL